VDKPFCGCYEEAAPCDTLSDCFAAYFTKNYIITQKENGLISICLVIFCILRM